MTFCVTVFCLLQACLNTTLLFICMHAGHVEVYSATTTGWVQIFLWADTAVQWVAMLVHRKKVLVGWGLSV